MTVDFLKSVFAENAEHDALVWRDEAYSYRWLAERWANWQTRLESEAVPTGSVVVLEADFSPDSIALYLALVERGCILVPLTAAVETKKPEFIEIAEGEMSFSIDENDNVGSRRLGRRATHAHYQRLRHLSHPGLVLFSSGSTGKSKASVHDLNPLLEKFKVPRRRLRTSPFLLYDHIGGVNTMFYTLSNGGCLVTVSSRDPDHVLEAVERHGVELLPTSPTFINLILLSEAYRRHRMSSLKTVTYGTEPMPESTLRRFNALFPNIRLQQTYGSSEVGILRSKSKSSDSLWVKVGGEGFETRVVNGILEIKAESAMLGYLNAPEPFTEDGWFVTGDSVQVEGEYLRILGRQSEIINVGGEKVYPGEVESVIQDMDGVAEVTVSGEKSAITGNIVCADVRLRPGTSSNGFAARLKKHCAARLQRYKVPVKVTFAAEPQHSVRFKKRRPIHHDT